MNGNYALCLPYAAFDFDGTLVDSNGAFIEILMSFFTSVNLQVNFEFIERAKTMNFAQTCSELKRLTRYRGSASDIGDIMKEKSVRLYREDVILKPGAAAYVKSLLERGIRLCVVSATDEDLIRSTLRRLEIEDSFEFVITVSQIGGISKNRPDIFYETARRFGTVPEQIVVYDDALEALLSAKSAGMRTVCVYDDAGAATAEAARKACDIYFDSYEQGLSLLNGLAENTVEEEYA